MIIMHLGMLYVITIETQWICSSFKVHKKWKMYESELRYSVYGIKRKKKRMLLHRTKTMIRLNDHHLN